MRIPLPGKAASAHGASSQAPVSSRPGNERLRWADLAKGACMLLVVLHHVFGKHYDVIGQMLDGRLVYLWHLVDMVLVPIRMPLFFTVSGMLAASALARPWRTVAVRRLVSPYYLYVLWILLSAGIYAALRSNIDFLLVSSARELVPSILLPNSTLWYLYALAAYFLVAKLLRRAPVGLVLAVAAALSTAVAAGWLPVYGLHASTLRNLVFFLAGAYLPSLVRRVASEPGWTQVAVAAAGYLGLVAVFRWHVNETVGVQLIAGFAAIWLGVLAAAILARWDGVSRPFVYIGRRTLPIFLLHVPVIAALNWVTLGPGEPLWAGVLGNKLVAAVYPVVMVVVVVAACLSVHRLLLLVGASWLFAFPRRTARPQPAVAPAPVWDGPQQAAAPNPAAHSAAAE